MSDVIIKHAWIEKDNRGVSKLCVRYSPDTGAENFGCFGDSDKIIAADFVGLTVDQAVNKFIYNVYCV
jgi:hypothetical protein